jgi:hypothetical protein
MCLSREERELQTESKMVTAQGASDAIPELILRFCSETAVQCFLFQLSKMVMLKNIFSNINLMWKMRILGCWKAVFNFGKHLGMPGYSTAAKGKPLTLKHSTPDFTVVLGFQNCSCLYNPCKTTHSLCLPSRFSSLLKRIKFLQARYLK